MSTHSAIIEKLPDGTYRGVYCHWDGHIRTNGATLLNHYADPAKVSALIDLGNISQLGERVDPVGRHSYQHPEKGTTVAYGRDRGDTYTAPATGPTLADVERQIDHDDYVYVFEDGTWTVNGRPLAEALELALVGDEEGVR